MAGPVEVELTCGTMLVSGPEAHVAALLAPGVPPARPILLHRDRIQDRR
jgi:hypothetical protein